MGQDDRVVVDVDDLRVRGDPLGDLVRVVGGRQAGADVQELADLRLAGQVPDGAVRNFREARATSTISG